MEQREILNRLAATECQLGDLGKHQLQVIYSAQFKIKFSARIAGDMTPQGHFSGLVK